MRASDADREAAIARLRVAAGEGRLTLEELADRVEAADAARTQEELDGLLADLPVGGGAGVPVATVPARASVVFADVRRAGPWVVTDRSSFTTLFGDVVLDLREATIGAPEVTIDAGTVFGDVQVLVPEGVLLEVRSRTLLGSVRQEAGVVAAPGAPRVVLTGGTVFGDVRVRAQRRRERLAARLRRD